MSKLYKCPSNQECTQSKDSPEKLLYLKEETILKLKESTKKLLCVLDKIQIKKSNYPLNVQKMDDLLKDPKSYNKNEDDDCSIYKRLTRKCNCLNQAEYNDFVIHFNQYTKYRTSIAGELIKNMRILKKFLYMNGSYTKNALLFLKEGLIASTHPTEKVDIVHGCAYADVCNVFDEPSIVIYIGRPKKNNRLGDCTIQKLTALLLYKLAQLEEGRRYLNFTTKISNEINKVIRKISSDLEVETVEFLNATLRLLNPSLAQNVNVTYFFQPFLEGVGKKTVETLEKYRQNMTLDEVFTHLELLFQMSNGDEGKMQLIACLPGLTLLFKRLIVEFDNSEINIIITKILNNVVSKTPEKPDSRTTIVNTEVATEPILMKNETNQITVSKNGKNKNKSKLVLENLGVSTNKLRNTSRRKG